MERNEISSHEEPSLDFENTTNSIIILIENKTLRAGERIAARSTAMMDRFWKRGSYSIGRPFSRRKVSAWETTASPGALGERSQNEGRQLPPEELWT